MGWTYKVEHHTQCNAFRFEASGRFLRKIPHRTRAFEKCHITLWNKCSRHRFRSWLARHLEDSLDDSSQTYRLSDLAASQESSSRMAKRADWEYRSGRKCQCMMIMMAQQDLHIPLLVVVVLCHRIECYRHRWRIYCSYRQWGHLQISRWHH